MTEVSDWIEERVNLTFKICLKKNGRAMLQVARSELKLDRRSPKIVVDATKDFRQLIKKEVWTLEMHHSPYN